MTKSLTLYSPARPHRIVPVICLVLAVLSSVAISAPAVLIKEAGVRINTIGGAEIKFSFFPVEQLDYRWSIDSVFMTRTEKPVLVLRRVSDDKVLWDTTAWPDIGDISVDFVLELPDSFRSDLARAYRNEEPAYLDINKAIPLRMAGGARVDLTPEIVKKYSLAGLHLTGEQMRALKQAASGNQTFKSQNFSLSQVIGDSGSTATEYVGRFDFTNPLENSSLVFHGSGRFSTLTRSPLNGGQAGFMLKKPIQTFTVGRERLAAQFSVDGVLNFNQALDTSSLSISAGFESLIPNLINLSGKSVRLRLKPVISTHIGYNRHFQSQRLYSGKDETLEFLAKGYYYVPVGEQFAITVDADARYSKDIALPNHWLTKMIVEFSYDLPLDDLKTLARWESGRGDFSLERTTQVLIGLLIDLQKF